MSKGEDKAYKHSDSCDFRHLRSGRRKKSEEEDEILEIHGGTWHLFGCTFCSSKWEIEACDIYRELKYRQLKGIKSGIAKINKRKMAKLKHWRPDLWQALQEGCSA